jgi:hypothetical protein
MAFTSLSAMQLHITPVMEPGNKSLAASLIESINLMLP